MNSVVYKKELVFHKRACDIRFSIAQRMARVSRRKKFGHRKWGGDQRSIKLCLLRELVLRPFALPVAQSNSRRDEGQSQQNCPPFQSELPPIVGWR